MLSIALVAACATLPTKQAGPPSVHEESFLYAWQRVGDVYPDPDLKGLDWDSVREDLLPQARAAQTADEVRIVIAQMLALLGESHFAVIPGTAYDSLAARGDEPEAPAPEAEADDEPAEPEPEPEPEAEPAEETAPESEPEPAEETEAPDPDGPVGSVGLTLRLIEAEAVVTAVEPGSPADEAGVQRGWVLEQVGTQEAGPLAERLLEAMPRSGGLYTVGTLQSSLAGTVGTSVTVRFRDARDAPVELALERAPRRGQAVRLGMLPEAIARLDQELLADGRVAYVSFTIWLPAIAAPFGEAMAAAKAGDVDGVIIDLRGNPGGVAGMVMGMGGYFVAERGVALATMTTRENTLRFVVNPRAPSLRLDGVPLAILIDGHSVSTSEIFATGLQKVGRARVFGETSAGMALPSIIEELPNGDALQFVTADLLDPDGERVEGVGAVPDVVTPLTREALLAGHDPALDAALDWLTADPPEGETE